MRCVVVRLTSSGCRVCQTLASAVRCRNPASSRFVATDCVHSCVSCARGALGGLIAPRSIEDIRTQQRTKHSVYKCISLGFIILIVPNSLQEPLNSSTHHGSSEANVPRCNHVDEHGL